LPCQIFYAFFNLMLQVLFLDGFLKSHSAVLRFIPQDSHALHNEFLFCRLKF